MNQPFVIKLPKVENKSAMPNVPYNGSGTASSYSPVSV